jgi:hypothetical protein
LDALNPAACPPHAKALGEPLLAILIVSNPYRHGIDFKNPFTMSKKAVAAYNPMVAHGDIVLFIFWIVRAVDHAAAKPRRQTSLT